MVRGFYFKLALNNIQRNRKTFLPYIITTAIISGVYLLIGGLLFSDGLRNLPSGSTATGIFAFGIVVFTIFAFFFMVYINNYIIGRRKKEFGLYGILGLERRHVRRVLTWENLITLAVGVAFGMVLALVFGRLIFMLLLKIIHAASGSVFKINSIAYLITLGLFFCVFLITSILNSRKVRLASPVQLLSSEKRGEKESAFRLPLAIIGLIALIVAYYFAWTIDNSSVALGVFFLLAILVIIATNLLFTSGSILALKALRANKKLYYKPGNFIAIGGMFQRMRQNAKSLATICILSTMLIVTISGTLSLYIGQEKILNETYPYDVSIAIDPDVGEQAIRDFDQALIELAGKYNVTVSADRGKLVYGKPPYDEIERNNYVRQEYEIMDGLNLLYFNEYMRFDVNGSEADSLAFMEGVKSLCSSMFPEGSAVIARNIFKAREEYYGMYGGLLFLGVFFGLLFLAVTVLIIYFKQVSEGYEDKEQFAILQKVGMDDKQVKSTINRQVLWVFFIPLGMTLLHMVFASKIMAKMIQIFMLYDWVLVLSCIGGVCLLFTVLYLIVYKLTSRVYYSIVKW
ncbi:MAG: ABC transporter permease [Papillibacter sp.]|nr:ABC transporter permease [Papillibacter sp.]